MSWYKGTTLLDYLEHVEVSDFQDAVFRFNVQYVIRPHSDEFHDFRGYAGKVKSGKIQVGDKIAVLASGQESTVKAIHKFKEPLLVAKAGDSVTLELETDIDISRGDIVTQSTEKIEGERSISSKMCWLGKEDLVPQKRYLLQSGSAKIPVKIEGIESQLDFDSLNFEPNPKSVSTNSISKINLKSASPLFLDKYKENQANGYFILIDESSNATVAVGFKE
jgi:sulfate adenylyltransferase subunit 1